MKKFMDNITVVARPTGWSAPSAGSAFTPVSVSGERETKRARIHGQQEGQGPSCKLCSSASLTRTSRSEKNPGKQYWACSNSTCSNKFIEWVKVTGTSFTIAPPTTAPRTSTTFKTAAVVLQEEKSQPPKYTDVTVQCSLCGNAAVSRTSRSEKNPGKKYWACPNSYCTNKFIEWVKVFQEKELPGLPSALTREAMDQFLAVTPEQVVNIRSFKQKSPEWLQARVGRLTASNFGAAAGFSTYQSPNQLLQELLWGTFEGNRATRWGQALEDMARMEYIKYMYEQHFMTARRIGELRKGHDVTPFECKVWECGLTVWEEHPFLAGSPDGLVHTNNFDGKEVRLLLEIKCPGPEAKLPYAEQPAYQESKFSDVGIPPGIPPHYYCQLQGLMAIYGLKQADFVVKTVAALTEEQQALLDAGDVWNPVLNQSVSTRLHVTRYNFDETFWNNTLFPRLQTFYYDKYLRALTLQKAGILQPGETEEVLDIDL